MWWAAPVEPDDSPVDAFRNERTTYRPGLTVKIAAACFAVSGLWMIVESGFEAAYQLGMLGGHDVSTQAAITEIDRYGSVVLSFRAADGATVRFENDYMMGGWLSYGPLYAAGETVLVRYRSSFPENAGIVDDREWFGIAAMGIFGLFFTAWGWLAHRFKWGALAGAAGIIALKTIEENATLALLQFYGYA